MKSAINILLSLLLFTGGLFPHSDMAELGKVPVLVKHYKEHKKQESCNFNFMDFLILHYGHTGHSTGNGDHSGLPLIKHQCTCSAFVMPVVLNFETIGIHNKLQHCSELVFNYFFQSVFSLLQPPK
jgi:hypothetical protein